MSQPSYASSSAVQVETAGESGIGFMIGAGFVLVLVAILLAPFFFITRGLLRRWGKHGWGGKLAAVLVGALFGFGSVALVVWFGNQPDAFDRAMTACDSYSTDFTAENTTSAWDVCMNAQDID
jgi:hypothetical protein